MSIPRIYQPVPLQKNQTLCLDQQASHHLARVLRAKVGDALILFNGESGEYAARICQLDKKTLRVEILDFISVAVESPLEIHLAQGIARGEKMAIIVQKAVELGVKKITPLITERCNMRLTDARMEKRLAHWQSIMISACEQSGRDQLPSINPPLPLSEWLATVKAERAFVLSPHASMAFTKEPLALNATIALLIGPEGGLSEAEVAEALHHGFSPLTLGPRILRTETATLAAITLMQAYYGDMGRML